MRPDLPQVTLVAATSVAIPATLNALHASMRQARFAETILLSDRRPPRADPEINWRPIEQLNSRADYSRFMLRSLAGHIHTSHALCIQWDGFVLNGGAWNSEFLEFDYIGAVWPQFSDGYNVGNGGFSLRSRRLLEACAELPFDGSQAEDLVICREHRRYLEGMGLRFAPDSVAHRFSFERTASNEREFGFHGSFNLVRMLPPDAALRLFGELEPEVLARSECIELLRWAIKHRYFRFALTMLNRMAARSFRGVH